MALTVFFMVLAFVFAGVSIVYIRWSNYLKTELERKIKEKHQLRLMLAIAKDDRKIPMNTAIHKNYYVMHFWEN